ncbi:hypothetical protein B0H34DRAFT_809637 [Crassisporium funariophilum]|nr:hypothetical protein B0H34DRAFT_809637 [Crassisporium funariophilum]
MPAGCKKEQWWAQHTQEGSARADSDGKVGRGWYLNIDLGRVTGGRSGYKMSAAHTHTRNPGRPTYAILRPLSQTVGFSPAAWFLFVFLLFEPFPYCSTPHSVYDGYICLWLCAVGSLAVFSICISLMKILPLGATALMGYFILVLVLWDAMVDLLASPLSHFQICCWFLGGSDQCALNPDGTLKDASKISFFNDPDDTTPIASGSRTSDDCKAALKRKRTAKKKGVQSDNHDFVGSSSNLNSTSDSKQSDSVEITLKELADSLLTKTIPMCFQNKCAKPPKKQNVADLGSLGTAQPTQARKQHPKVLQRLIITQASGKQNPIYLFYEHVTVNKQGEVREEGSTTSAIMAITHKTFTISKAMNYSLNEVVYASGKMLFDPSIHTKYIQTLGTQAAGIKEAFARKQAKAAEPWDQEKFEKLLIKWIAACDQPFDKVSGYG